MAQGKVCGPNYLLDRKTTGSYRMRITLSTDRKTVGRRRLINLKTQDLETARVRRDKILRDLTARGWVSEAQLLRMKDAEPALA